MNKTIQAHSGHTLHIKSVTLSDLPENVQSFEFIKNYKKHYEVRNWNAEGHLFFYVATDCVNNSKKEVVVWYRNGGFWSGYGRNLTEAINGAQKDGWMYA